MYREPLERPVADVQPRPYDRPRNYEGRGRSRIPQDDGRNLFLESLSLLAMVTVLAVSLGAAIGVPLAMMLRDICSKLSC